MLTRIALVFIALLLAAPVSAADLKKGFAAAKRGDYATALRELRPLAERGNTNAQTNLGLMYEKGWGVPKDYAQAVKWYRKAAEQGYGGGQNSLGFMYANGRGVKKNFVIAYMWWAVATERGFKKAKINRKMLVKHMTSAQIAQGKAMAREWIAACEFVPSIFVNELGFSNANSLFLRRS